MEIKCAYKEIVDVDKLVNNPRNSNEHPQEQIDFFVKILKYQGQRKPVVVSNRSGFITKGHGLLLGAKAFGATKIAVDYQDYESEAQEFADMEADNNLARLAFHNHEKMLENMLDIGLGDDFDTDLLGIDFELSQEKEGEKNLKMSEVFGAPPFSVLDARQGWWQERKREWIAIGIQSEQGRGGAVYNDHQWQRDNLERVQHSRVYERERERERMSSFKSQDKLSALRHQTKPTSTRE